MNIVLGKYLIQLLTAALKTRPAQYPGVNGTIRLFVNDITPTVDNVAADFREATASGYVALPTAGFVLSPNVNEDGRISAVVFNMDTGLSVTTEQTIFGWWWQADGDETGAPLTPPRVLAAERWAEPLTLSMDGQWYFNVIEFGLTPTGEWYSKSSVTF